MSKVNVDEIKVGDLISFTGYRGKLLLGYVNRIDEDRYWCYWSGSAKDIEQFLRHKDIEGHWKVVNFDEQSESSYTEEEAKMDELKVYTGKDILQALLEGKVLDYKGSKYKLEDGELKVDGEYSYSTMNFLMQAKLTEVATPQVGDWVKGSLSGKTQVGCVTDINEWYVYIDTSTHKTRIELKEDWQILSPEEVSEYKREQAFAKVGRKLNEFRSGDFVCINVDGGVSIVVSNNNEESVRVHMLNVPGKGYTAKPHQLTPISFVEQQVDLS